MATNYQVLVQEKAELVAKNRELTDKAGKDGLTDDEKSSREANFDRLEDVVAELEREERLQAYERSIEAVPDINQGNPDDLAQIKPEPPAAFESLGEQLYAVYRASVPTSREIDPRLVEAITGPRTSGVSAAATGLGETISSDGGYLVEKDVTAGISRRMNEVGNLLSRCRRIPVGANSNGLKMNVVAETSRADGSRWGGVQGYWVGEADEKTASKPKFEQLDLTLQKVVGLVYATDELLADAVALEAIVNEALPEELSFKVEDAIINGTGGGMPTGILNAAATINQEAETGQAAATILYDNIKNMWSRVHSRSRQTMIWTVDQSVEPQLYSMSQEVGTGGAPVFLPAGGASSEPFATLFGRPVVPIEYGAALGTVGDIMALDLNQYLIIEKGGVQSASSMHVRFIYDEMAFRFVFRVNGDSLWRSALTPKSGGNTLSPFITLATRS